MGTNKIIIIFSTYICLFVGCKSKSERDFEIKLEYFKVNVKISSNADAPMPPVINLVFRLRNLTNETKIFITKGNVEDERKSKLLLLDTLNNIILPIYSNSIPIVKGGEASIISGSISVREIAGYLKLDNLFLNKIDFSNDAKFLNKITSKMIDNSVIFYIPDNEDIKPYSLLDIKLSPFRSTLIKVDKSLTIVSLQSVTK